MKPDWREADALRAILFDGPAPAAVKFDKPRGGMMQGGMGTEWFSLFKYRTEGGVQGMCDTFSITVVVEGEGVVTPFSGTPYPPLSVRAGDTIYMPTRAQPAANQRPASVSSGT